MVIFHSYVSLPEGTISCKLSIFANGVLLQPAMVGFSRSLFGKANGGHPAALFQPKPLVSSNMVCWQILMFYNVIYIYMVTPEIHM